MRNQSDLNATIVNSNGTPISDTDDGGTNPCDVQKHMNSSSSWGSYFYVGGPAA